MIINLSKERTAMKTEPNITVELHHNETSQSDTTTFQKFQLVLCCLIVCAAFGVFIYLSWTDKI